MRRLPAFTISCVRIGAFLSLFFLARSAYGQTFNTIDVTNAIETVPTAINSRGQIAGIYFNPGGKGNPAHAFFRDADGTLTTFDVPGAHFTFAISLNPAGEIAGWYNDASGDHGYLRDRDGTITSFDVAVDVPSIGTVANDINSAGQITGIYFKSDPLVGAYGHGYLRDRQGAITKFDVPGAFSTNPRALNSAGQVTGTYFSDQLQLHDRGFLRQADGSITTFDVPGALITVPTDIDPAGLVTGWFISNTATCIGCPHGFVREIDGTITTLDVPVSLGLGTQALSINEAGQITGNSSQPGVGSVFFIRNPDGTFITFTPPGSLNDFTSDRVGINAAGEITGAFHDVTGVHGFVWRPVNVQDGLSQQQAEFGDAAEPDSR